MQKKDLGSPSPRNRIRRSTDVTLSAMSRILALLFFLIMSGMVGAAADRWLGTAYWIVVGFGLGTVFSLLGMFYVVKVAELENRDGPPQDAEVDDG